MSAGIYIKSLEPGRLVGPELPMFCALVYFYLGENLEVPWSMFPVSCACVREHARKLGAHKTFPPELLFAHISYISFQI